MDSHSGCCMFAGCNDTSDLEDHAAADSPSGRTRKSPKQGGAASWEQATSVLASRKGSRRRFGASGNHSSRMEEAVDAPAFAKYNTAAKAEAWGSPAGRNMSCNKGLPEERLMSALHQGLKGCSGPSARGGRRLVSADSNEPHSPPVDSSGHDNGSSGGDDTTGQVSLPFSCSPDQLSRPAAASFAVRFEAHPPQGATSVMAVKDFEAEAPRTYSDAMQAAGLPFYR